MADKFMLYIPKEDTQNITSVDYDQWLKRWDTQLTEPTNQNLKSPKMLSQQIIKRNYKTLGTSAINNSMIPSSLSLKCV